MPLSYTFSLHYLHMPWMHTAFLSPFPISFSKIYAEISEYIFRSRTVHSFSFIHLPVFCDDLVVKFLGLGEPTVKSRKDRVEVTLVYCTIIKESKSFGLRSHIGAEPLKLQSR